MINDLSNDGLSIGVVSSHGHEDGHVTVWDQLPEVTEIHVCAIADGADLDTMSNLSSKIVSKNQGLDKLLDHHALDAVGVCVRPDLGPPTLTTIIEAGLPVLFDKPAATRAADMKAVADLAATRGITAGAMFMWRYSAAAIEAKRILSEGGLGDLWSAELRIFTSQIRYRRPSTNYLFKSRYAGSGILSWLSCHQLDLLSFLTDDHIIEVMAMTGNLNPEPIEVEDTAMMLFKLSKGAMGTMSAGYLMAGPGKNPDESLVTLRGSKGYIEISFASPFSPTSKSVGHLSMWSEAPGWETGGLRRQTFDVPPSEVYGGIMSERLFSDFLRSSKNCLPAPSPIESSVHMLEVVEAAKKSSMTKCSVKLDL